jgi:hypothetical protein
MNFCSGFDQGIRFRLAIAIITLLLLLTPAFAYFMKLNINKTRVISFSRKTNTLIYDYKLVSPL